MLAHEQSNFVPSRRHLGALVASAAVMALPATSEASPKNEAELLKLEEEAKRLRAAAYAVRADRVDPYETEFDLRIRHNGLSDAFAFGRTYGRNEAVSEMDEHFDGMDRAIEAAFDMPASSATGRAAKVRMLVRHYFEPLREPFRDLNYDQQLLRLVLAEYAGMTPDDFAAI